MPVTAILSLLLWKLGPRPPLTAHDSADFRSIALSLANTEESSHMGAADFRVGGRIFGTLAHQAEGFGNLMRTPEQQAFLAEAPDLFLPAHGGWGCMGITHIRLAAATEDPSPEPSAPPGICASKKQRRR